MTTTTQLKDDLKHLDDELSELKDQLEDNKRLLQTVATPHGDD